MIPKRSYRRFFYYRGEKIATTIDNLEIRATGNSQSAIASIDRLIQRLERLQRLAQSATASFSGFTGGTVRITNITNSYNRTLAQTNQRLAQHNNHHRSLVHRLATTVGQMYILFMAAKKVANVYAEWYNKSNDFIENMNLFEVTMRDNTDAALDYAESVERIMGIDLSEWLQYQGTFQQLSKGFGVASGAANVMSQNLTQLSYDLGSFFNVDTEKAFDKLSSAMAGQVKGLREFGIDTSVASLQQYALSKGIELTVSNMTQAQKAVLRYNYILEKSVNIQGDLARTIVTPSNALRILNAQMEKLRRTLGNIISTVVTKFIPYVQAAVMIITDWADALAKKWGFETPSIDYIGLDDALSVADDMEESVSDIADNFADAAVEAKKFKNQLMGFDELNILKSPVDNSSDVKDKLADLASNYPSDLGLGTPSYDFGLDSVSSQAKKIYKKTKDFLQNLTVGKILEKAFSIVGKGLKNVWDWFSKLETKAKFLVGLIPAIFAIKGIQKFVSWVKTGVGSVSGFISKVRNAEGWTGKLQRAGMVAAGAFAAGFAGYDFFSDLIKGTVDWKNALLDIPLAVGGVGLAFAAGGWVGAAVAGLGALAGAVIGIATGLNQLAQNRAMEDFTNTNGPTFSELAGAFARVTDNIAEMYNKYNETFDDMEQNKGNINGVVSNIGLIGDEMLNNVTSVQSGSERIMNELGNLQTGISTQTELIYQSIHEAIGGAFGEAADEAGFSVDRILELTALTTSGMNEDAAEIVSSVTELTRALQNGEISKEEYAEKWRDYQDRLFNIIGQTDGATEATNNLQEALSHIGDINWEDETARSNALDKIKDSAKGAKDSINEYYDNLSVTLSNLRDKWKVGSDEYNSFTDLLGINESAREKSLEEVNTRVNDFMEQVQQDIGEKVKNWQDKIDSEWESLDPLSWEKIIYGTKDKFALKQSEAERDFVKNISDSLQDALDEIGTNGKIYAGEAMEKTIDALTVADDPTVKDKRLKLDRWKQTWSENFRSLADDNAKSYNSTLKDNLFGNSVFDYDEWYSKANKASKGFYDAISSNISLLPRLNAEIAYDFDIPNSDKKVYQSIFDSSGRPSVQFKQYAHGGYPDFGEIFLARESGPEMVGTIGNHTAVANNEQIVTAIERGVYNAMMSASAHNSSGGESVGFKADDVTIGGDILLRAFVRAHNNYVYATGQSPLVMSR